MKEVFVVATENEVSLAKKYSGGSPIPIIVMGVGGVNVIRALSDLPKDVSIVNVGYAGSNNIPIGEEVRISCCRLYHPHCSYLEAPRYLGTRGVPCYTSTDFVTSTDILESCVFDMELAFICALGFSEVRAIKVVSDNLNYDQYEKVNEAKPCQR